MLLWLVACAEREPIPCEATGALFAELAPADVDYADFVTGDPLRYGRPPQGGSPYSPYRVRSSGLADLGEGAAVRLQAHDLDADVPLGDTTYELQLLCANVGDNAGLWVGSDLHQRFDGFELDDLEGRRTRITATVTDLDGLSVSASIEGVLERM